jgi:hypothetical protein
VSTHKVPATFRLTRLAVDQLRQRANKAGVNPATLGAELLEGFLGVPGASKRRRVEWDDVRECFFVGVYTVILLELLLRSNEKVLAPARTKAEAETTKRFGPRTTQPEARSGEAGRG